MKRVITPLLLASSLMVSLPLFADNGVANDIKVSRPDSSFGNLYLGGSIGQANYNEMDDSDIGFNLFSGIELNEFISAELGWVNFGEAEEDDDTVEASAFYLAILGSVELQSDFSLFGKLGFSSWDADFDNNIDSYSESGSDVLFGLGANYQFNGHTSVKFAIDQYALGDEDVTMFTVGFKYTI
ncbi:MAG: hypothetical protein COB51_03575 [Moraxellaceae bacterium]|nr:MAG: hypothetical protein COB51_03575 [Moraxellaceae bacterium]